MIFSSSGSVELNVDGSFNSEEGNGGCGMVLRDEHGAMHYLLAMSILGSEAELDGILKTTQVSSKPCLIGC